MAQWQVISNPTDTQIGVHWHNTPYFVPPKSAIIIPTRVADDCLGHEDYSDILVHDIPDGVGPEDYAKTVTNSYIAGTVIESRPAPKRDVAPPEDTNPDWDPITCAYTEIDAYIDKTGLNIDPDLSEQDIRQLVDEHSQTE